MTLSPRVEELLFLVWQDGKSALQVWGGQFWDSPWMKKDEAAEDEDKEAFRAHVEALFADVL